MLLTHSSESPTRWVLRMFKAEARSPQWLPGSDPRKSFFQENEWRSVKEAQLLFLVTVTRKTFKKAALKTSRGFLYQICLEEGIFQSLLIITTSLVVKRLKLRASSGGGGGDGGTGSIPGWGTKIPTCLTV